MTSVAIVCGNSDNKLTQQDWSRMCAEVDRAVDYALNWAGLGFEVHGRFHSLPNSGFQNACWLFSYPAGFPSHVLETVRERLAEICEDFRQDSVIWLAGPAEFVTVTGLRAAGRCQQ